MLPFVWVVWINDENFKTTDSYSTSKPGSSTGQKNCRWTSFLALRQRSEPVMTNSPGHITFFLRVSRRKIEKRGDSRDTVPTPVLHWMSVDVTSRDDWRGQDTYQIHRAPYNAELFPISVQQKAREINDCVMSTRPHSVYVTHGNYHVYLHNVLLKLPVPVAARSNV